MKPATLQPDDQTLSTRRHLAAPPERVWQAFADPLQLARWWGPDGFSNVFERFDFQTGGAWHFWMVGPDGQRHWNENRFDMLQPPHRMELAHVVAPRFTLTVTLTHEAGGTQLAWAQRFETAELCRALEAICLPANEQNLDRLGAVLAGAA
jgi:uncharacterized protein YndB with AHSA1/START domain